MSTKSRWNCGNAVKTFWFVLLLFCFYPINPSYALLPAEILLIANNNDSASQKLAVYYQQQRQIPNGNLLTVSMTTKENCSRAEYEESLVIPLRNYFSTHPEKKIRCLLLFYGLPLRVAAPELSNSDWKQVEDLKYERKQIDWKLQNDKLSDPEKQKYQDELKQLQSRIKKLRQTGDRAAVDSEIALVLNQRYPLDRWQPNPYFVGFSRQKKHLPFNKDQVLFVSRLDGPTPAIVRRMIDDSLYAEQHGLRGQAWFDARWPLPEKKNLQGYALYDASIHKAAAVTEKLSSLTVHLDEKESLFQPGKAPEAALYCGWYSLGKYVDAFDWQRGAVGYHIASSEATTLKKTGSQVWCKRMLEEGVAATIGPVAEPYVQGFPLPELFFSFLLDGYYTLAESYFLSLPYLSWQMILIGDPLYRPFRNVATGK